MPAPTLQAEGALAVVTTGNLAITTPAYEINDIVVIAIAMWAPNTAGASGINTPSGYTTIAQAYYPLSGTNDGYYGYYWRRASASSTGDSITITRTAGWDTGTDTAWGGRAYVIRGCETSGDPWDHFALTIYTTATGNVPAVTVSGSERTVIQFLVKTDDFATAPTVSGWTSGTQVESTTGTDHSQGSFRKENVSSSTTAWSSTVEAPAAGFYTFLGISFKPPVTGAQLSRTVSDTITTVSESIARILTFARAISDSVAIDTGGPVTLIPDTLLQQDNLTGALSTIQDDPDSPDANWMTALDNNTTSLVRVGFPTPSNTLSGAQEFKALVRKMGGTGSPSAFVGLFENGTFVSDNSGDSITGDTIITHSWDASAISNPANVECRVYGSPSGGGPSVRAALEVGAIEWNAVVAGGAQDSVVATILAVITRTIDDTVSIGSDVVEKVVTATRTLSETVSTTDSIERILTFVRTILDTTVHSESLNRAAIVFSRTINDVTDIVSDLVSRSIGLSRTAIENIAIGVDTVSGTVIRIIERFVTDTVSIGSDVITRTLSFIRSTSDIMVTSDAVARVTSYPRTMVDSLVTSDAFSRTLTMIRSLADTTIITDSLSRVGIVFTRIASDTVNVVSDAVVRVANKIRSLVDITTVSESISRSWTGARTFVDTLPAIVDSISTSTAIVIYRVVSDTVNVVDDTISRTLTNARSAIDNLVTSDTIVRVAIYARAISDGISSVSDFVVRGGVLVRRGAEDSLNVVTDFIVAFKGLPKFVGEFVVQAFNRNRWRVGQNDGPNRIGGGANRVNVRDSNSKENVR